MNIADEKKRFIELLDASYQANLVKHEGYSFLGALALDPSKLYISGSTLEQFGFDYKDSGGFFWSILCPALKGEGYLMEYTSFSPMSERTYLQNYTDTQIFEQKRDSIATQLPREYWSVANDIASGRPGVFGFGQRTPDESCQKILNEIGLLTQQLKDIREKSVGNASHEFVINEKKLSKAKAQQHTHVVIDDTPDGASWRALQVRFTDGRTLLASFPTPPWNKPITAGELRLEKNGNNRLKVQWSLLEEAAANNGQIQFSDEGKRRQINSLQQLLKEVFPKLTGNPFEPLGGGAYRTTFAIETQVTEEDYD